MKDRVEKIKRIKSNNCAGLTGDDLIACVKARRGMEVKENGKKVGPNLL